MKTPTGTQIFIEKIWVPYLLIDDVTTISGLLILLESFSNRTDLSKVNPRRTAASNGRLSD